MVPSSKNDPDLVVLATRVPYCRSVFFAYRSDIFARLIGRLLSPIGHEFAKAAHAAGYAAGPVHQADDVAFAFLGAKLFGHDDVIVPRQSAAGGS
jgi:hypothetical protein